MSNIVQNSGFEELGPGGLGQAFQNWTNIIPNLGLISVNSTYTHSGLHAAQFNIGGTLSQVITFSASGINSLVFYGAPLILGTGVIVATITGIQLPQVLLNITASLSLLGVGTYKRFFYTFNVPEGITSATLLFKGGAPSYLLDDVTVVAGVACYSGDSIIKTRNIKTGEINDIIAKNVYSNTHEVFSVTKNEFIPVKLNIVCGPSNKFRVIGKNTLGENQPSEDFYITSGHRIVVNGIATKVRNIPQAKKAKNKNELVYSICVDENQPILVNNLSVIAWGYDEWIERCKKIGLTWKDNSPSN